MYIYADVLIITNIYMDFLLIKSAAALTHSPLRKKRGAAAAVVGSLFSLAIFLPAALRFLAVPVKLLSSALIVYIAFGYSGRAAFLRRMTVFYLCAFVYGGIGTGLAYLTGGRFIVSRNGIIYADFSLPALVAASVAAYTCIAVYRRISGAAEDGAVYTVIVSDCGKCVSFKAIADTGNILRDSFTGKYVIVCPRETLAALYGSVPDSEGALSGRSPLGRRWRLIPCRTVSSSGLIAVIYPQDVCLKNDETGELSRADVYLGAAPESGSFAVFNPKILI